MCENQNIKTKNNKEQNLSLVQKIEEFFSSPKRCLMFFVSLCMILFPAQQVTDKIQEVVDKYFFPNP